MAHLLTLLIYLAFIGLGLPDCVLGAVWPAMHQQIGVPLSYSGGIFFIIAAGTVIASLFSDRISRVFSTHMITSVSIGLTCFALLGFSLSTQYWMLCLFAIPYGLGAGSVDAALNHYVALHYPSRHMSWLHCMWGIGAAVGPFVMSRVLAAGLSWNSGYRLLTVFQLVLTVIVILSSPLWKTHVQKSTEQRHQPPVKFSSLFALRGAKPVLLCFFCYTAVEQTTGLWVSSFLVFQKHLTPEAAAASAALFFLGITAGRFLSGFLTLKFSDNQMITTGLCLMLAGITMILFPFGQLGSTLSLLLIGLGCAPVYPCIIHATPDRFGASNSQAMIGLQMACAYTGNIIMPPLFGVLSTTFTLSLFPFYLLFLVCTMLVMQSLVMKKH